MSAAEAAQSFSAVELSGQPVLISLGDINGDGYSDAIVSVRDLVPDGRAARATSRASPSAGATRPAIPTCVARCR